METPQQRKLASTGQSVWVVSTFILLGRQYCKVLIPYSDIEKRISRNGNTCHLQIVREDRLLPRQVGMTGRHRFNQARVPSLAWPLKC